MTPFTPVPAVCVPAPDSRGSKAERRQWIAAIDAADRGESDTARILVEGQPEGPRRTLLADVIALHGLLAPDGLRADAPAIAGRLVDVADSNPVDPCLQHTAALAAMLVGRSDDALRLSRRAVSRASDHPEVLAGRHTLLALTGRRAGQEGSDGSEATDDTDAPAPEPTLEQAVAAHPDHPTLNYLLGLERLGDRDAEGAIAPLEIAAAAGIDVTEPLLLATRAAEDLDRYLRIASREGLPLGDQGALAEAESPRAAFAELLGVGEDGELQASIETSEGTLTCELLWEEAPITVGNFVGLARGTQPWADPQTGEVRATKLYDGTVLHRVIPSFMVQGGDPTGVGSGGPGYRFMDETVPPRRTFDRPGLLAMANAGPNTNGSQWFITEVPVPYLNGRHTIFGVCDDATLEVVQRIARVPTDAQDRPQEPIVVERVTIQAP